MNLTCGSREFALSERWDPTRIFTEMIHGTEETNGRIMTITWGRLPTKSKHFLSTPLHSLLRTRIIRDILWKNSFTHYLPGRSLFIGEEEPCVSRFQMTATSIVAIMIRGKCISLSKPCLTRQLWGIGGRPSSFSVLLSPIDLPGNTGLTPSFSDLKHKSSIKQGRLRSAWLA